jgi:hypothetical protein
MSAVRRAAAALKRAADSRHGRMVLSAFLTLLLVGITACLLPITFLTNDDASIMYTFAGYYTGEPYPIHGFINLPLGYLVSMLYLLAPAVPWWPVLQLICVAAAIWAIFHTLWNIGAQNGVAHGWMLLLDAVLYALVLIYPLARLSFTMTACVLGSAGVLRLFSADTGRDAREPLPLLAMLESLGLMIACFLFRNSTGYSLVCFWAAGVVYHALNTGVYRTAGERKREFLRLGAYALAGILAFGSLVWLNGWTYRNMNPEGYATFEEARGNFFDFPHVAYADDPAFYESIGWDKETYLLVENGCFIDPSVTAESLNAVIERGAAGAKSGLTEKLSDALAYGEAFFRGNGAAQYMLAVPALTAAGALYYVLLGRRRWIDFSILTALSLGAAALCFYLCWKERLILRAFQAIALPTAVLLPALFLRVCGANRRGGIGRAGKIAGVGLAILALAAFGWSLTKTALWFDSYHPAQQIADMRAAERYAMDHRENVYIVQPTFIYNNEAFKTYPDEKPVNIVDWGDTGMYSGWKTRQLEINGLDALTPEIFRLDNVFLMGTAGAAELQVLIDYLVADAGAKGIERADGFGDGYAVYKVVY